jgi:hypothetical protein
VQLFEDRVTESCANMADRAPAVAFAKPESQTPAIGPLLLGAVKPAITTSCRFDILIFRQLSVRTPDKYLLSPRFAMIPSRPLRSASSKNLVRTIIYDGCRR